ncbi:MAG TPA: S41 family peptidase [Candidatus Dojkabacteria bacterium]|nr:S41 family peptidase [Candidatus Dojkabacteria bacterium]
MEQSEKNDYRYKKIVSTAVLLVAVFVLGIVIGQKVDGTKIANSFGKREEVNMDMFWNVWDIVSTQYVDADKVDSQKMVTGAIKGMVNSFEDPATVFLDPEETEEFNESISGKYFEGIGAELGYSDGNVIVVSPLEGSPAKEAGIRPGDYILKIDDYELTASDTVYDAVAKIRGDAGTKVTLTILHKGEEEPVTVEIVRREITVSSMQLDFVGENKDIAHLKVNRFTETSLAEWERLWDSKIDEVVDAGSKKMILDLRGNPGGYFDAAVYAGDEFIDEGKVIAKERDGSGNIREFKSRKGGKLIDVEVVVLVDEGSASASEILAGSLQQNGRAKIVGMPTYGKGTAQTVLDLADGSSLHITILKWLLPDGQNIDRDNSIKPDVEVDLTNEDFKAGIDPQLSKAIEILSI